MVTTYHSGNFRLALDCFGKRTIIEYDHDDLTSVELVQTFYHLAIAAGWQPHAINDAMREVADDYDDRDEV